MVRVDPDDELLNRGQVAALLDIDADTVTRWAAAGKFAALRTPGGNRMYLRSQVLTIVSDLHPDDTGVDAAQDSSRDGIQDSVAVPAPHRGRGLDAGVEVDPKRRAAAAAVVAEAVAVALEEVAVESAEAVLVTAAAVTEAAGVAADAAETARGARAVASDAAAQSVAAAAARAATLVQVHAETAATHVRRAAALAADELAQCNSQSSDEGTELESGREAQRLEATVRATAQATSEQTVQAASVVREADLAAAARVAQRVAAEEEVVERQVAASAEAAHELATATAAEVALETDARAAGVAIAAREAAATHATRDRAAHSAGREVDPDRHDLATPAGETHAAGGPQQMHDILAAAEARDSRAELRDRVAEERERATAMSASMEDKQDDQHAGDLALRRAASLDRSEAKTDRASAAADRTGLSTLLTAASPGTLLTAASPVGGLHGGPRMLEVAELSEHLRAPLRSIMASVERLEVALRESDDRLRLLVDAVTDYAIISLSTEGIIESWNSGAERLKGYTPEEALGRHFSIFYTAEDREADLPQRLLDQARAKGSYESTGWRVRKDGSQFWGNIVISAAHDDVGNLTGFVKVVRDLTEQHRLEVAQDSFYNLFEHDFRVPITAIKGFADLVRDADPEDHQDLVERVDANADRLLSMAKELVDYARLRSGLVPINLQIIDLAPLARLAVANLASIADTSRVQVTAAEPVQVLADTAALERVIANLITNALKYSPAGTTVSLTCDQVKDVGVLRIIDQGRGIDERDLGSIFLEFERGRLARDDSGTGLGLASVHRLVGLLHGTVAISSQVEVGTTVTIELPLAR